MPEDEVPGFVYLYSDGGRHVKVGRTATPEGRRLQLSAGRPDATFLRLVETDDMVKLEEVMHFGLAAFWVQNEWFRECPELVQQFDALAAADFAIRERKRNGQRAAMAAMDSLFSEWDGAA